MEILNKKAFSVIEYTLLFVIIIGAFLVMRNYIQRGIFGLWVQPGQSFAFGRQYDSQKTIECAFDDHTNLWYDRNCFTSSGCAIGDASCENSCSASSCTQLNK